jgi:hypothetical protein
MNILKPASLASTLLLSGAAFASVAPDSARPPGFDSYDGERC